MDKIEITVDFLLAAIKVFHHLDSHCCSSLSCLESFAFVAVFYLRSHSLLLAYHAVYVF